MEKTKFRFYKFTFKNKSGKRVFTENITFSTEKKLRDFIKRKKVEDSYISLNSFQDYQNKKPKNIIERNYCIDMDNVLPKEVIKAVNLMRKKGYEEKYILQSSVHNYQIFYQKFSGDIEKINKYLIKNKIQDSFVSNEPNQVIRLPESKHHTGFIGKYVTIAELKKRKGITLPKKKSVKKDIYFYYKAVMSRVTKDRHILILKNPNIAKLKRLQKIYKIGNIYSIFFKSDIYAVSLKTFSLKRLQKIYKAYGKEFNKYNFLRTSQKVMLPIGGKKPINYKGKLKVLESGIRKINILKSPIEVSGQFSRPHFEFIRKHIDIEKPKNLIGKNLKFFELELKGKI